MTEGAGGESMAEAETKIPRSFSLFVGVVVACGIVLAVVSGVRYPPALTFQLIIVVLAAILSEWFSLNLPSFTISLAYPLAMSAVVLAGPFAGGIVAAFSSGVVPDIRARRPTAIVLFNFWQLVLGACAAGWIYIGCGGRVLEISSAYLPLAAADFPLTLFGMIAAALLTASINVVLTGLGIALFRGGSIKEAVLAMSSVIPTNSALALMGFLMAQVLSLSPVALLLFIFPLAIARQLYQRYASLSDAFGDTIRSLVRALEAKDPYTRGHSERVADYAKQIGLELQLERKAQQRLEYAALLHDLGKLAVPASILRKTDRLTDEEFRTIQLHPARGADMIGRIPPLRDLAEPVGKHHERYAGGGYPLSVDAPEIPQLARILAVADSYDAMTSDRAYRRALSKEEAIAELFRCEGNQFDPEIVHIFARSVSAGLGDPMGADDDSADVEGGSMEK